MVCEFPCPPGTFGEGCGGVCDPKCSWKMCDHVFGCREDKGNRTQPKKLSMCYIMYYCKVRYRLKKC